MLKQSTAKLLLMLAVLVILLSASCRPTNTHPFYKWVLMSCEGPSRCKIRLRDYADFEWDKVYVFAPHVMEYQIKEVLGQSFPLSGEYSYHLVFLKGNEIVHHFESPTYVSEDEKGRIHFMDFPNSEIFKVYDNGVVFDVAQQSGTSSAIDDNFLLSCQNCD